MGFDDATEDEIYQQLKKLGVNVGELRSMLSVDEARELAKKLDWLCGRHPHHYHKFSSNA